MAAKHHGNKLVVVDHAVTVLVSFADHLGDLVVRELLAEVGYALAVALGRPQSGM